MLNYLGKLFVLIHTLLSVVAMTWALGLFLDLTDWGWKEPRQELEGKIASEYDKSAAALKQAVRVRDLVYPAVKPARDALRDAESQFPQNHLFYVQELKKLRDSTDPIEVRELKTEPDPKGKVTGKPVFDAKLEGLDKSLVAYAMELQTAKEEAVKVEEEITDVLKETQKVTFQLTGKDDSGKQVTYGLYDLVDAEYKALTRARQEKDELKPIWAQSLEEARLYTVRRNALEQRVRQLEKALGPAPKRPGS